MARTAFRQSKNKRVHGAVCTQEETCCLEAWAKAVGQTTAVGVEGCGQLDAWTKAVGQTTAVGVDEVRKRPAELVQDVALDEAREELSAFIEK